MRTLVAAAFLLAFTPVAFAQDVAAPPSQPAPSATAPIEERAEWCDRYASWLIALTPDSKRPGPVDVRDNRRFEVELNYCKLDPREYERQTRTEADRAVETASG